MANKSLTVSGGFNWLMSVLAPPLIAGQKNFEKQSESILQEPPVASRASSRPVFLVWPDLSSRAVDPRERMRADLARLHQATLITSIR